MAGGFVPRFAIEAGFLILLGVGSGLADLRPAVIVAVLAAGWLLVSLVELAIWRAQSRPAPVYAPPVEPVPEPEPEPVHGWPIDTDAEEQGEHEEVTYPLRADAGSEPSDEVEAYTRILESERDASGERAD